MLLHIFTWSLSDTGVKFCDKHVIPRQVTAENVARAAAQDEAYALSKGYVRQNATEHFATSELSETLILGQVGCLLMDIASTWANL